MDIFTYRLLVGLTPRHHAFERSKLEPQMYMFIKPITTDLGALQEGVKAITLPDERWARVDIKTLKLKFLIFWHKQKPRKKVLIQLF